MKIFFGTSVNVGRLCVALGIVFLLPLVAFATTPPQLTTSLCRTAGLKTDGTVLTVGYCGVGQCAVSGWTGITQIAIGHTHSVGLKSDGSVVVVGGYGSTHDVERSWTNITQIAVGGGYTAGLKSDGTVVVSAEWDEQAPLNPLDWNNIVQISAGREVVVGLKSDGTVVAAGNIYSYGQNAVTTWKDIVQISTNERHIVGLKKNGTVVAVGDNSRGQCNVSSWTGITQISAGTYHTVGLKSDGTVVAVGYNEDYQCNVSGWSDIIQIAAGFIHTVGLKKDGTVVAVGDRYGTSYSYGQCNVGSWNLGVYQVAVPNVVNLNDTIAEKTITDANLKVGAWDSIYNSSPANTVINQNPVAGTLVSLGTPITLTVSLGAAPVVYEATATLTIKNQKTKAPIGGVNITTKDKDGKLLQTLTTDASGVANLNMPKAGKIWIYESKKGFTPVLYPDVQVINKGAKNNIVSYMNVATAAKNVVTVTFETIK